MIDFVKAQATPKDCDLEVTRRRNCKSSCSRNVSSRQCKQSVAVRPVPRRHGNETEESRWLQV